MALIPRYACALASVLLVAAGIAYADGSGDPAAVRSLDAIELHNKGPT